jgi:hypothetical protein
MARFDGSDHSIKKVNKVSYFNKKNEQKVQDAISMANNIIADSKLAGFKKEHDL